VIHSAARRAFGGLRFIAVISAAILPLWMWIASAHLHHWLGGEDLQAWRDFVTPWSARLWGAFMLVSLGSWTAYMPRAILDERRIWTSASAVGIIGFVVAGIVAIPGWVWLSHIGDVAGAVVVGVASLALVPPLVAVSVAVVLSRLKDRRVTLVGSWLGGGASLWVVAGSL
jgi:hypothetical protein